MPLRVLRPNRLLQYGHNPRLIYVTTTNLQVCPVHPSTQIQLMDINHFLDSDTRWHSWEPAQVARSSGSTRLQLRTGCLASGLSLLITPNAPCEGHSSSSLSARRTSSRNAQVEADGMPGSTTVALRFAAWSRQPTTRVPGVFRQESRLSSEVRHSSSTTTGCHALIGRWIPYLTWIYSHDVHRSTWPPNMSKASFKAIYPWSVPSWGH